MYLTPDYCCVFTETTAMAVESYTQLIGDGVNIQYSIPHRFNTFDVGAVVRDTQTNLLVYPAVKIDSLSSVTLSFNSAPATNAYSVTLLAGLSTKKIDGFRDRVVINIDAPAQESVFISVSGVAESLSATLLTPSGIWGTITGNIQDQIDLWNFLIQKFNTVQFTPTLTSTLLTYPITLSSVNVQGSINVNSSILSSGVSLFDIFLTDTSTFDRQTLSYTPSSFLLTISNGNTISLSSIITTFSRNSANYEASYVWTRSNSSVAVFQGLYSTNISAVTLSGTFYGDGSNLTNVIIPGQALVNTVVQESSANWNSNYNTTNLLSSNWNSVYNTVCALSSNWNNVYNTVSASSINWDSVYNTTINLSSSWEGAYSITQLLSDNWNSVYNTTTNLSSNWESVYNTTINLSSNWQSVYNKVSALSGNWNSVYNTVCALSSNWNSVYNTTINLSSVWGYGYNLSNALASLTSEYLPLSGGTLFGLLSSVSRVVLENGNINPILFVKQTSSASVAHFKNNSNEGLEINNSNTNLTSKTIMISGNVVELSGSIIGKNFSVSFNNSNATGLNSFAEGFNALATGINSHAEGSNTHSDNFASHAEGADTQAFGYASHAEGSYTVGFGNNSHVEGSGALAYGSGAHAEGEDTGAMGDFSHTEGRENFTGEPVPFLFYNKDTRTFTFSPYLSSKLNFIEPNDIVQLSYTTNIGLFHPVFVVESRNTVNGTITATVDVVGQNLTDGAIYSNSGLGSHAEGVNCIAEGVGSHAEGVQTYAAGDGCHVEGTNVFVGGDGGHGEGRNNYALGGTGQHVEGNRNFVANIESHVEGTFNIAGTRITILNATYFNSSLTVFTFATADSGIINNAAAAFGQTHIGGYIGWLPLNVGLGGYETISAKIIGFNSQTGELSAYGLKRTETVPLSNFRGGWMVFASARGTHVEGDNSTAMATGSHAEGQGTLARGIGTHVEGGFTIADGFASHAEGWGSRSIGGYSHTEGGFTLASGGASHAEGQNTTATGIASHAEGGNTFAIGGYSHCEGWRNWSYGLASHAEGQDCYAMSNYSHAEGFGSTTARIVPVLTHTLLTGIPFIPFLNGTVGSVLTFTPQNSSALNYIVGGYFNNAAIIQLTNTSTNVTQTVSLNVFARDTTTGTITATPLTLGGYTFTNLNIFIPGNEGSHAEGVQTCATGTASHTEGFNTRAVGYASHAAGFRSTALHDNTFIWSDGLLGTSTRSVSTTRSGQYMVSASGGVFIPGNAGIGTDSIANALTVVGTISTNLHYSSIEWKEAYNIATVYANTSASIAVGQYLPLSGGIINNNLTIQNSISLSSVKFTGNSLTSTTGITATDIFIEVQVNGVTKYIRLFDAI